MKFQRRNLGQACLAAAIAAALGLAPCAALAQEAIGSDTQIDAEQIDAEQIKRWVRQLDDDRYDQRQRAQQHLEKLGDDALDAVASAAASGSLESVTRAVEILLNWTEGEDKTLRMEVLQRMANLPNRPREAAMAARLLASAREKAALDSLTKLGAKFEREPRVPGFDNLQVVLEKNWKGGSEGLKHLADVPRATSIKVLAAPVDDSIFEQLSKLPNVQRIELYKTANVSTAAADEFEKKFQRVVDHRRGAMLGIVGLQQGQGVVTKVVEGSAADKAGIQPDDIITKFNGENVDSFHALTQKIGEYEAGDSANLTVLRGEETFEVKVTFDDMADSEMMQPGRGLRTQITPPPIRIIQNNQRVVPQQLPIKVVPAKEK